MARLRQGADGRGKTIGAGVEIAITFRLVFALDVELTFTS
jgi:hypothetical protein